VTKGGEERRGRGEGRQADCVDHPELLLKLWRLKIKLIVVTDMDEVGRRWRCDGVCMCVCMCVCVCVCVFGGGGGGCGQGEQKGDRQIRLTFLEFLFLLGDRILTSS
jgi:hypothetical protein